MNINSVSPHLRRHYHVDCNQSVYNCDCALKMLIAFLASI